MTELTLELDRLIQKAALDGALTEEAVAQFHAVLLENGALKDKNKDQAEAAVKCRKECDDLAKRVDLMKTMNADYDLRVKEVEDREKEALKLELTAKHQEERVTDHKDMFDKVFRNLELRRNIFTAYPGTDGGQYNTPIGGGVQENHQTEKKE